jgi:general secretion pathway protein K
VKTRPQSRFGNERGIALIIVMIVIIILAALAGGFAYSMKVETRLARNSSFDSDMEMLGHSGVELGRYVLAMQLRDPEQGRYIALNQKWAGGASTNELLADIEMEHNQLGPGEFSVHIEDMERKFNLSMIREGNSEILERALELIGADAADVTTIVDSYLDWTDPDENTRLHGAESQFYLHFDAKAPYFCKNGLMDDVSELLLLKGMTPEIYWGSGRTGIMPGGGPHAAVRSTAMVDGSAEHLSVGLFDLFTTISGTGRAINANTAPAEVLQLIPGMNAALARSVVDARSGPDHVDGTDDDIPFLSPTEVGSVGAMTPAALGGMSGYLTVRSTIFLIKVEAKIGNYVRHYEALVHLRNAQDVTILYFRWL